MKRLQLTGALLCLGVLLVGFNVAALTVTLPTVAPPQRFARTSTTVDPCFTSTKSYGNVNLTASAQLLTGTAGQVFYFCSLNLVVGAADNVAAVEGTGTTCATATLAVPGTSGGATAATGWNFAANGGIALGNGLGAIGQTAVAGDNVCLLVSSGAQVSGGYSYVVAPQNIQ